MRASIVFAVLLVSLAVACGDPEADALAELGALAESMHEAKDHAQSEALYARAAGLAKDAGLLDEHWNYRAQRGVCLKMLGRTEEAFDELLPALAYAREQGKPAMEALALGNLARCASIDRDERAALEWQDQLADVLSEVGGAREHVLVLEQAAMLALRLGDAEGALERLRAAMARNAEAPPEDDQSGNLQRELAWILANRGDDEGAAAAWAEAPASAAGRARQAQHAAWLDDHTRAASLAWEAARLFEEEGPKRRAERDDAMVLHLSELLDDGQLDACERRLDELLAAAGDQGAGLAGLNVVRARLWLARGRAAEAAGLLADVRRDLDAAGLDTESVGWLEVWALGRAARVDEAHALLDELPATLAVDVLRGWLWSAEAPELSVVDALPALDPRTGLASATSLDRLEALVTDPLPGPAFLVLHGHLTDAEKTRRAGSPELARLVVQEGVARSLVWQRAEAWRRLHGRWPAVDDLAHELSTAAEWASGKLPTHEGLAYVVPGPRLSYLVLCTSELGATTFGLGAGATLFEKARATATALRDGTLQEVALLSHELYETVFGARAQVDLKHKTLWTLLLPDGLLGVPPAMYVTESPLQGGPTRWLAEQVFVRLLPHLPGAPRDPPARPSWVAVDAAAVDLGESRLARPWIDSRYGASAREPRAAREGPALPGERHVGADATAAALRDAADGYVLEVGVTGLGGQRFGGLLLAPDADSPWVDESLGLLPWRRLPELSLPPIAILDGTRFDPSDTAGGPAFAASALWAAGARTAVLTRWPVGSVPRDPMLSDIQLGEGPMFVRMAMSQRGYLQAMRAGEDPDREHPRHWAMWMVFEG